VAAATTDLPTLAAPAVVIAVVARAAAADLDEPDRRRDHRHEGAAARLTDPPDRDVAHVATRIRIGELVVIVDEVRLQRRHVGGAHQLEAVALQAVDDRRTAGRELSRQRLIGGDAQLLAGRPDLAAARGAVDGAGRGVAITDRDAAVAVAQL